MKYLSKFSPYWVDLVFKSNHLVEGTRGWKVPLGVNSSPCPRMPISIIQDILDKNCDYLDIGPSLDLTWVIIVF